MARAKGEGILRFGLFFVSSIDSGGAGQDFCDIWIFAKFPVGLHGVL